MQKRVACIHDLSCYSRCSLLVALPVLYHYGFNVCPVPTALLSTHTGGYTDYTFLDLSDEMEKISAHFEKLGASFDAIYSGFLGNEKQINTVMNFITRFSKESTLVLVDPVMGDEGEMYRTYTRGMCDKMHLLCKHADIITPNLTEAYILTGREYNAHPDKAELELLLGLLSELCVKEKKAIVITGVQNKKNGTVGVVYTDTLTENVTYGEAFAPNCPVFYSGVGELLASLLLAKTLSGESVAAALNEAVDFISRASFRTAAEKSPSLEGVLFEDML